MKRQTKRGVRKAKRDEFVAQVAAGFSKQLHAALVGHDLRPGTRVRVSFQIETPHPHGLDARASLERLLDALNHGSSTATPVITIDL